MMVKRENRIAPDGSSSNENLETWLSVGGVRDESGGPLIVYHGSPTPGSLFEFLIGTPSASNLSGDAYGVGAYFTSNPHEASRYALDCGAVFPVILRGNFLDLDGALSNEQMHCLTEFANDIVLPSDKARFNSGRERRTINDVEEAKEFFQNQQANFLQFGDGMCRAKPEVVDNKDGFTIEYTNFDAKIAINTPRDAETLFKAIGWNNLRAAGFDGVIMSRDGGAKWFVVHNALGTIKSAIGNNGLFDPACSDITDATSYRVDYEHRKAVIANRYIDALHQNQKSSYVIAP
jgi:hypothetical protein